MQQKPGVLILALRLSIEAYDRPAVIGRELAILERPGLSHLALRRNRIEFDRLREAFSLGRAFV